MVCRILVFVWPLGPLLLSATLVVAHMRHGHFFLAATIYTLASVPQEVTITPAKPKSQTPTAYDSRVQVPAFLSKLRIGS